MKILIVNKFLYPNGGSETYIFKIGEQLQKMGHEVQYFGMEHEGRIVGNHAESYTSNMDFHTGKLQKLMYPFKIIYSREARKKIRKVLDDFKPDVVHLNNFNFQLTPSVIYEIRKFEKQTGKKVKIVFTAHDSQLVCPNHLMLNGRTGKACQKCLSGSKWNCTKYRCIHGSFIKSVLGTLEALVYGMLGTYREIDKVICPSKFMAETLSYNKNLKNQIVTIQNFLDKEEIPEQKKEDYILYFGRYSEEKGIATLLKVCRKLEKIPFVFAGKGPLEQEVNKLPNIVNKGFLKGKDLYELIQKARLVVFPSECFENCPFTVMEAQIYGTPIIASSLGGVPELIKDSCTGRLFEAGNVSELTRIIEDLWFHREKLDEYTENCKDVHFSSLEEYCETLVKECYD